MSIRLRDRVFVAIVCLLILIGIWMVAGVKGPF
jgi:hypothetical protein